MTAADKQGSPEPMDFPPIQVAGEGTLHARLVTSLGTLTVRLFEKEAPKTVANFVGLATGAVKWVDPTTNAPGAGPAYDGVRFHRVIPGFMIQCGDLRSRQPYSMENRWGTGKPGYTFEDEFHPSLRHDRPGVLSMANSGRATNGSQFFVTEVPTPHLDDKHSVFGVVVEGVELIKKIANTPRGQGDRPVEDVVLQRVELFRQ